MDGTGRDGAKSEYNNEWHINVPSQKLKVELTEEAMEVLVNSPLHCQASAWLSSPREDSSSSSAVSASFPHLGKIDIFWEISMLIENLTAKVKVAINH